MCTNHKSVYRFSADLTNQNQSCNHSHEKDKQKISGDLHHK